VPAHKGKIAEEANSFHQSENTFQTSLSAPFGKIFREIFVKPFLIFSNLVKINED